MKELIEQVIQMGNYDLTQLWIPSTAITLRDG